MMGHKRIICSFLFFSLSNLALAIPYYGINFSYALSSKEPSNLNGYQLMLNYDPQRFTWKELNLYFDGGFSYFRVPNSYHHSSINIYSIAPIVRFSFKKYGSISPFLELSVGLSYLNRTRIEKRNLGIHFAFQDRMGMGALFGNSQNLSIGIHAVHYSNAHLSSHNSGISIPLVLDVGYRF